MDSKSWFVFSVQSGAVHEQQRHEHVRQQGHDELGLFGLHHSLGQPEYRLQEQGAEVGQRAGVGGLVCQAEAREEPRELLQHQQPGQLLFTSFNSAIVYFFINLLKTTL